MENGQFIDDFPMKTSIYRGFSMAMLNNQRVSILALPNIDFYGRTCGISAAGVPGFWWLHLDLVAEKQAHNLSSSKYIGMIVPPPKVTQGIPRYLVKALSCLRQHFVVSSRCAMRKM